MTPPPDPQTLPPPPPQPRPLRLWMVLAIPLLVLAVMGKSCAYGFVDYDDHDLINNPHMAGTTWGDIAAFWGKPYEGQSYYKPMSHTLWGLLALISQQVPTGRPGELLNPHLFHAANIVIHAMAALMVLLILFRLVGDPLAAFFGAALFALHPIQVEAVAWCTGLPCSVSALFMLASLWLYLRYADAGQPRDKIKLYALATLAFLAAVLSKPTATVQPVLVGVVAFWLLRRPLLRIIKEMTPWLLMALPLMLLTKSLEPDSMLSFVPALWQRVLIMGDTLTFYVSKVFVPSGLSIDYGRTPEFVLGQGWIYATGLAPFLLALLLWRKYSNPWIWAGLGIFVVGLGPVLGLVPFGHQEISTTADRYLYPSMLGPALLAARGLKDRRRPALLATASAVLLLLALLSLFQTHTWSSSNRLLNNALEVNPNSSLAHVNFGVLLARRNKDKAAMTHLRRAVELRPHDVKAHYNLALLYARNGRMQQAAASYEAALKLSPAKLNARKNLAMLLLRMGQTDQAIVHYRAALKIRPADPTLHNNLGVALEHKGNVAG